MLHPFSAAYAEAIGGYPSGATIAHPSIAGRFLICTADENSNDPGHDMGGWVDPLASLQAAGDYATNTALMAEEKRATAAEAGLLPLSGGTLTGTITTSRGGIIPEIMGVSGRVIVQPFTTTGSHGSWIPFPVAFSGTPYSIQVFPAHATDYSTNIPNYYPNNSSNQGFTLSMTWLGGGGTSGAQTAPATINIVAHGPG